jgi:glutamate/tyrosine decarboxylase-like PLP-dependent enzyme
MSSYRKWRWTPEEIRRVGGRVIELIADHLGQLPHKPVFSPFPNRLKQEFAAAKVPVQGEDIEAILDQFANQVGAYPFGNGHPHFHAWINSPPAVIGVFAEALAAAMNPSCAGGNHAAIYVEHQVLNWFKEMLGFPAESGGLLVSGGSMATLTGLAVARHVKAGVDIRAEGLANLPYKLTVYMSEEGHGCIRKAVELLGLGSNQIRQIPVDADFRMRLPDLEAAIRQDLAAGHRPLAVAASAGTVNTGAIDPIREIAELCRQYDLWLHVDGAYGAPAILTDEYRAALGPLALADSLALDPHKWLYIPVEAGLILIRNAQVMRDAFSHVPPYLRFNDGDDEVSGPPWFSEYGFQQTRGFRALKVWMALKYHGLAGYKAALERDIALARRLAGLVSAAPDLELLEPAGLSIVCFRYRPPAWPDDQEQLNPLNQRLLKQLQLSGEAFLSGTTIRGQFMLRACIVNPHSTEEGMDTLVELVRRIGRELIGHAV